ncbi:MAG TPA: ABC transporter permease [Candidatus Deferrimicrobium sp.]|nr:ABC transporter permease [Candidatus Deferrimicrobium sp.]
MTASTATVTRLGGTIHRSGSLPGLRALVRKDIGEWAHGSRAAVIVVVGSLFMGLAAANSWLNAWVIANVPEAASASAEKVISLAPLDNFLAAVASQIFIFAAIFAAMSLLVRERDSGTLAWVASKPVSRSSILVSKWLSATAILWLAAGIIPLTVTTIAVTVLYGAPPIAATVAAGLGIGAAIGLFVAVVLAASTFVASQPAVAGLAFAVFVLPTMVNAVVPFDIAPFEPTSILSWALGAATGAGVGFVTPIAWVLGLVGLGAIAGRRMASLEL